MKTNLARTFFLLVAIILAALAAIGCSPQPAAAPTPAPTPTPVPAATPTPEANPQPNPRNDALARLGIEPGLVGRASADSLTMKTRDGMQTWTLTSSTVVVIPGQATARATDLQRGDRVLVKKSDDAQTAALVMQIPADATFDNVVAGQVQSVENGTLALRTKKGSETMTTNATTVVVKLNGDQAALGAVSDLQNGNLVLVFRPSADSANAQVILTLDRGEALSKVGRELLQKR